jgi:hypothetical protein
MLGQADPSPEARDDSKSSGLVFLTWLRAQETSFRRISMPCDNGYQQRETVRLPLRQILAESHIAAIAVAVLLLRSFEFGVRGLGRPLVGVVYFLVNVVAIGGIPYRCGTALGEWLTLIPSFAYLFSTAITLSAAWLLSRWVYGVGPFRSLSRCCTGLARRSDA